MPDPLVSALDRIRAFRAKFGEGDLIDAGSGMTTDDLDRMIAVIGAGESAAMMPRSDDGAAASQQGTDEQKIEALLQAVEQPDLPPGKR